MSDVTVENLTKLIELGTIAAALKAENTRLKDENAFLRKLLERCSQPAEGGGEVK